MLEITVFFFFFFFFGGGGLKVNAGPEPRYEENMRVFPGCLISRLNRTLLKELA